MILRDMYITPHLPVPYIFGTRGRVDRYLIYWLAWEPKVPNIWGFQKKVVPQIIHVKWVFHYKPSILGYPYFLETSI